MMMDIVLDDYEFNKFTSRMYIDIVHDGNIRPGQQHVLYVVYREQMMFVFNAKEQYSDLTNREIGETLYDG